MPKYSGKTVEFYAQNLVTTCDYICTGQLYVNVGHSTKCAKPFILTQSIHNFYTTLSTWVTTKFNLLFLSFSHFTHNFITTITYLINKKENV